MSFRECCHIKADGLKCKSPALNRQSYCYFHHRWNKRQQRRIQLGGPVGTNNNTGIEMPILESYEEIQIGIMEVLQAIIDDRVSSKRAGLMLYALQLASTNTRFMQKPGISQPGGVTEEQEIPDDEKQKEKGSETLVTPNPVQLADVELTTTVNTALKGHGFSRAETGKEKSGALAPEVTTLNAGATDSASKESGLSHAEENTGSPLIGHGFSRAEPSPENSGASAPEVRAPRPDALAELCQRYPGVSDENLIRFLPQPNDDDTRLYFNPDDSIYQRQKINERRILLGIYL